MFCSPCPTNKKINTGFGLEICTACGLTVVGGPLCAPENIMPRGHPTSITQKLTYTRRKRFRKYLSRACMKQNTSSIPNSTWEYLIDRKPYSRPEQIIHTLKKSKLKMKCYDSLPLLCANLTDINVPKISQHEFHRAMQIFLKIDENYSANTEFVSYLYMLEYILLEIGRRDLLPFINKIRCPKRRRKYSDILFTLHEGSKD